LKGGDIQHDFYLSNYDRWLCGQENKVTINNKEQRLMKTKVAVGLICAIIMAMVLPFASAADAGEIVVIANKDVPLTSIDGDVLKNIFLAKKTQWDNGHKIDFVTLKCCDIQKDFLKTYLKKTPTQYQRYFRTLIFTGKGKAPRTLTTGAEVVSYVSNSKGAIGYVSSGAETGLAKILTVN
jgi:hypothetical protein